MSERNSYQSKRGGRAGRGITWRVALVPTLFAFCLPGLGCGNAVYAIQANAAANKLEEARELGADTLAPYEYYYAREHLLKAKQEATHADYSDAINFAEISEEYAEKAIRLSRDAHRGAGR